MLPEERIAQMRDDLASSKTEIIHHVTGLYSNNKENARFNLKEDPFHELGLIKNQVTDILELSKAKSANYKANEEEIKECSSMIAVLEKVSDISDKLMTCEEAINKLHLTTSCRLIGEIEGALIELPGPNTELGAGEVCSILRKESKMLKTRLMSKSRRLILECIKFDYGRIVVNKQLKGMIRSEDLMVEEKDAITMSDVWDTIVMMNKTEEIVDEMIRKVNLITNRHLIPPILSLLSPLPLYLLSPILSLIPYTSHTIPHSCGTTCCDPYGRRRKPSLRV